MERKQDYLDRLVTFLAKRDGIDKLVKTLQYTGKLSHWHLQRRSHPLANRAKALEVSCGLSRKAFRLGRWLSGLNALRTSSPNWLFQVLAILANAGEMVYFFFDHFTWLARAGVLDAKLASTFCFISASGEAFGYIFFIISDAILIAQGLAAERKHTEELKLLLESEKTKGVSEPKIAQQIQLKRSAIGVIRMKRIMQVMGIAANIADFVIALADIEPNPFVTHAVTLGISGLVSAWAGATQVQDYGQALFGSYLVDSSAGSIAGSFKYIFHTMDSAKGHGAPSRKSRKLPMLPLVFLIFYEVSGGPFGVEDSVRAGGPLLTLLGFAIMPFLWSIPEALITAELATAFPENGGYVVWIEAAFGSFWGFQEGWWKWLSGVIDNALYPVMFLDYLKWAVPSVAEGPVRLITLVAITAALTYLNYRGLTIVGYTAVALGILSLLPFVVLFFLAIPRIEPKRWLVVDLKDTDWRLYLNTLFWNLNYWDSVSTLVEEVERPIETVPKALYSALMLVVASYLLPLLAGTGAGQTDRTKWADGYFAHIALKIGGSWLKWWVELAALLSNAGMFEAEMSSDSFQLLGMAERGMLPKVFAYRSKYGTPVWGILCSATGVILLSWLEFQEIIEILNFLYCFGMLLEFAAFVQLRIKQPNLVRPYKVPLGTLGVTVMCVLPSILLVVVMCIASGKTVVFSVFSSLIGFLAYPALEYVKKKKWVSFSEEMDPLTLNEKMPALEDTSEFERNPAAPESEIRLLST